MHAARKECISKHSINCCPQFAECTSAACVECISATCGVHLCKLQSAPLQLVETGQCMDNLQKVVSNRQRREECSTNLMGLSLEKHLYIYRERERSRECFTVSWGIIYFVICRPQCLHLQIECSKLTYFVICRPQCLHLQIECSKLTETRKSLHYSCLTPSATLEHFSRCENLMHGPVFASHYAPIAIINLGTSWYILLYIYSSIPRNDNYTT